MQLPLAEEIKQPITGAQMTEVLLLCGLCEKKDGWKHVEQNIDPQNM